MKYTSSMFHQYDRQKINELKRTCKVVYVICGPKGYFKTLRKIIVPRVRLSAEYQELLGWKLKQIYIKDSITVIYYDGSVYLKNSMIPQINKALNL